MHYKVIATAPDGTDLTSTLTAKSVGIAFGSTVVGTDTDAAAGDYSSTTTTVSVGTVFDASLVDDYFKEGNETYTVSLSGAAPSDAQYENIALSTAQVVSTISDAAAETDGGRVGDTADHTELTGGPGETRGKHGTDVGVQHRRVGYGS